MKVALLVLVLVFSAAPLAYGHPFTERTIPDSTSNAPIGATEVVVFFSEAVDVGFSEIKVYDGAGNQVDKGDTSYYEGETSLIVTTAPMEDGFYTVSTKVLSKVDGHLVPGTFIFAAGSTVIDPSLLGDVEQEVVFLPEAGAKFPGMVGQTIVLGAAIASLAMWGRYGTNTDGGSRSTYHAKFMQLTGIGLGVVFASNILIIAVQALRVGASPLDLMGTYFGMVWAARMAVTVVLLVIWFVMDTRSLSGRGHMPMLALSLVLISTTSLVGHGAATEEPAALALDYVHNLVAAAWIGGIIYFAFVLLPSLPAPGREMLGLTLIPRFSMIFIVSLGIIIVSGPMLMWSVEGDVGLITESVFGRLLFLKLALASGMVAMGGYVQFRLQAGAKRAILSGGTPSVYSSLRRSLKGDVVMGIAILGVVALMTNATLPAGEVQRVEAQETIYGFSATEFSGDARIAVDIRPFSAGTNEITVRISDLAGNRLDDSEGIKVKIANPSRNIFSVEVPMEEAGPEGDGPSEFRGEVTFGFYSKWLMEISAERGQNPNETVTLELHVKPRLADINAEITEYDIPDGAAPLHIVHDNDGSLWISDTAGPRVWQFEPDGEVFTAYEFDGVNTTFLALHGGKVWFTDRPGNQIGHLDTATGDVFTAVIPKLDPLISGNRPLGIAVDSDGNAWATIVNKDRLVKYDPETGKFDEIVLQGRETLPFALAVDQAGTVWYSKTGTGTIGYVDDEGEPVDIETDFELAGPEALIFDELGNLWIAEHTGLAITRFNPVLGTFERNTVPDADSLPFGMAIDAYGNVWFAEHTVDKLGVFDPHNRDMTEFAVPTAGSFVQFVTSDEAGNIWFAEAQTGKIGVAKTTAVPVVPGQANGGGTELRYGEFAGPMMAAGIVAVSLFYVRAVREKRSIDGLVGAAS